MTCKYKLPFVVSLLMIINGCNMGNDLVDQHRALCRSKASLIIKNKALWLEFLEIGNKNYISRKTDFPQTGERLLLEYAEGFDFRYGSNLSVDRENPIDETVRNDIFVLKEGVIVAQLIDFVTNVGPSFGPAYVSCLSLCPDCYNASAADA
jgi:hypothetical protein